MITGEYTFRCPDDALAFREAPLGQSVFFDIETTGFKASCSHLYLIGAAYLSGENIKIIQWMSERPQEEAGLLRTFDWFLRPFRTLIHFNGNRFDIPYMTEKYEQYALASPFDKLTQVDIYQDLKCLRPLLGLSRMNQKTLENFLGVQREDRFNGGELIQVYRDYVRFGGEDRKQMLLLHNREDVQGMVHLLSLYTCRTTCLQEAGPVNLTADYCSDSPHVSLQWKLPGHSPVRVSAVDPQTGTTLTLEDDAASLLVPCFPGTLFHFFDNWKDYYFLPAEDQAIHKSIASFVDPGFRRKASARNCYIKKEGLFLPQNTALFTPVLKRSYDDRMLWFPAELLSEPDQDILNRYRGDLLKSFIKN